MRELTKSAFTLPWALSMVAVQQVVNLVAPPPEGRVAGARAAFDAVSLETEQQLDGWLDQALKVGDSVQRFLVGTTKVRPPSLDSSGVMRLATDPRLAPLVQATSDYGLQPAAWLDALRLTPRDRSAALQELSNKLRIIRTSTEMPAQLDLDLADERPLPVLLDRAAALAIGRRLLAVETLGAFAGDRALKQCGDGDPQDVLTDQSTAALPDWSLMMLHSGLGSSFASLVLRPLTPTSSPDLVRHGIARFVTLCRRSSRRGYTGAAFEAFGLVARSLHQSLVAVLDREIQRVEPGLLGHFWHGAGRSMYLDPVHMLPTSNAPKLVIDQLNQEATHEVAYRNALAGIAWATTTVNIRHPLVMELVLRHHNLLAADNDAFANGVSSAIVVQHDTTPDDPHIAAFVSHQPSAADAAAEWQSVVTSPCRVALGRAYGELRRSWTLGQLFQYRSGAA